MMLYHDLRDNDNEALRQHWEALGPALLADAEREKAIEELMEAARTILRPFDHPNWRVSDMEDRVADLRAALAPFEAKP
jgi:hypothetical protein